VNSAGDQRSSRSTRSHDGGGCASETRSARPRRRTPTIGSGATASPRGSPR
jgi:hypothetical protein